MTSNLVLSFVVVLVLVFQDMVLCNGYPGTQFVETPHWPQTHKDSPALPPKCWDLKVFTPLPGF